jgi:hypothetical protein
LDGLARRYVVTLPGMTGDPATRRGATPGDIMAYYFAHPKVPYVVETAGGTVGETRTWLSHHPRCDLGSEAILFAYQDGDRLVLAGTREANPVIQKADGSQGLEGVAAQDFMVWTTSRASGTTGLAIARSTGTHGCSRARSPATATSLGRKRTLRW